MERTEHHAIASRIAAHMRWPWHRDYARIKVRTDPAYAMVAALLGGNSEELLDIGCGLGLLGFYLREHGFRGAYLGVDFDAPKIAEAQRVARHYDRLVFENGNANALPRFSGNVALLDVLHYLSFNEQQVLLHEAAARVAPGAVLIVRNVLRENHWRFHATVLEERILHAARWMRSPARHFPSRQDIEAPLRALDFNVDVQPLWGRTPFNSFMIVARRIDATCCRQNALTTGQR